MPEQLSANRLSREELELLQRKVLREWQASDWLAEHRPRVWQELADDGLVRVDLGSGVGESEQEPGHIALDKTDMSQNELHARSGESRTVDLGWDLDEGLPFEDETIDEYNVSFLLRHLPSHTINLLAREIARTLKTEGHVDIHDDMTTSKRLQAPLLDLDFSIEPTDDRPTDQHDAKHVIRLRLVKTKGTTHEDAPLREKEMVLGTLHVPELRRPTSA